MTERERKWWGRRSSPSWFVSRVLSLFSRALRGTLPHMCHAGHARGKGPQGQHWVRVTAHVKRETMERFRGSRINLKRPHRGGSLFFLTSKCLLWKGYQYHNCKPLLILKVLWQTPKSVSTLVCCIQPAHAISQEMNKYLKKKSGFLKRALKYRRILHS